MINQLYTRTRKLCQFVIFGSEKLTLATIWKFRMVIFREHINGINCPKAQSYSFPQATR